MSRDLVAVAECVLLLVLALGTSLLLSPRKRCHKHDTDVLKTGYDKHGL